MRYGFTTGSCAAAAAKAAAYMLLTGMEKNSISIITPKGITYQAEIRDISLGDDKCSCAVVKDGGDDPDITTGALVYAEVSLCDFGIEIDGGIGVGRVTMPGLDQSVGQAAINHVPRQMITEAVTEVMDICGYDKGLKVIISVPNGEELAAKTFNPKLGIEGGISILGTSGIVEPMSTKAILDTIRVELNQKRALGYEAIVISPGNYGRDFMRSEYDYELDKSVKCSNFIGDTIDMARELGYKKVLLVGHIGKLVKLSGGIMNTHSKEADGRMELLVAAMGRVLAQSPEYMQRFGDIGGYIEVQQSIMGCPTTEAAISIIDNYKMVPEVMGAVMDKAMEYLRKRAAGVEIECIMFAKEYGKLADSTNAEMLLDECRMEGK